MAAINALSTRPDRVPRIGFISPLAVHSQAVFPVGMDGIKLKMF